MLGFSVIFFLAVISTRSTAIPLHDEDISRGDSFENEVDGYFYGGQRKIICRDFYSYTCSRTTNKDVQLPYKDHLENLYWSEVYNGLIEVLNGQIRDIKDDPLDLERKLYQSCMKLGDDEDGTNSIEEEVDEASLGTSRRIEAEFNKILRVFGHEEINEKNWQKLDQKLASLGFKHSFFEVSVVKDPENEKKNIIRLSPPSITEWNFKKLTDVLSDVFTLQTLHFYDYCKKHYPDFNNSDKNNRVHSENDAFWESNEDQDDEDQITANKDKKDLKGFEIKCHSLGRMSRVSWVHSNLLESATKVLNLLNQLVMIIFEDLDVASNYLKIERTTIEKFDEMYRERTRWRETAAINWTQVLKSHFGKLNINIRNSDNILVENPLYFDFMTEIFKDKSNEIIALTIRSKFVAENIRYYRWAKISELNPINKQYFCLEQNKFYGASAAVLERLKSKMIPHKNKVIPFLHSIVDSLHSNISNTRGSEMVKLKLLSYLRELTDKPFKSLDSFNVTELYEGFEFTGNYLLDINRYKSMFRRKNLSKLHKAPLPLYRTHPFSVLEMENPRNRYTLHSILNQLIYAKQFSISKDAVFGTYGVKSASFLFSLLKEHSFENEYRNFRGILSITPRVSYKPEEVDCFMKENIVKYGYPADYDIITEVYGLRFAYDAMLLHSQSESHDEFFTAYTEDNCKEDNRKIIDKVLSNVQEFSTALQCSYNDKACNLQPFQLTEDLIELP